MPKFKPRSSKESRVAAADALWLLLLAAPTSDDASFPPWLPPSPPPSLRLSGCHFTPSQPFSSLTVETKDIDPLPTRCSSTSFKMMITLLSHLPTPWCVLMIPFFVS